MKIERYDHVDLIRKTMAPGLRGFRYRTIASSANEAAILAVAALYGYSGDPDGWSSGGEWYSISVTRYAPDVHEADFSVEDTKPAEYRDTVELRDYSTDNAATKFADRSGGLP